MDKEFKAFVEDWRIEFNSERHINALEILVEILRLDQDIEDYPLLPREKEKKMLEVAALEKKFYNLVQ